MSDQRFQYLANQVARYSLHLSPGEKVLIEACSQAADFTAMLVRAVRATGAIPLVELKDSRVDRAFILSATEEGMQLWLDCETARMERMDAYVAIRGQDNLNELSDIPVEQMNLYSRYHGMLHYGHRVPNTKWCVLRYPNDSMAQQANMSTEAFMDFYFNTCCLDYQRLNELVTPLRTRLSRADQIHLTAPGTDLTFSIKGLCLPKSTCGTWNVPCGETGLPIVQGSANGVITYNMPSLYQGFLFRNIRLVLRDGVIVEASANDSARLNAILDIDPGARRIGEFALGFNPYVTRPIFDTLFDEKMRMSLHFTPGNSKNNPSSIHWDLVTSHAAEHGGGEVWVDGELIRKDGLFIPDDLRPLNPDDLLKEIAPPAGLFRGEGGYL